MAIRGLLITLVSVSAFAQSQTPVLVDDIQTELKPSCIWNDKQARCFIQNKLSKPVICELNLIGTTFDGQTIGNTRQIVVQPNGIGYGEDLIAGNGMIWRTVKAHAVCN